MPQQYIYVHGFVVAQQLDEDNLLTSEKYFERLADAQAEVREAGEGWELYALVPAETLGYDVVGEED